MSEQEKINPYAAPQSEPLVARPAEERVKRPASVKWALALMIMAVLITSVLYLQLLPQHGWHLLTNSPLGTTQDAFKFIACFALLFGGRKVWVYWVTLVPLIFSVIAGVLILLRGWPTLRSIDMVGKIMEGILVLLFCYLFYRFTFGQPSRAYFGVSRVK